MLSELSWLHFSSRPSFTFAPMSLYWSIWILLPPVFISVSAFINCSIADFRCFDFLRLIRYPGFYSLPSSQMLILCRSCGFSCFFTLSASILVFVGIPYHLVLLWVLLKAFWFCYPSFSVWVDLGDLKTASPSPPSSVIYLKKNCSVAY